MDKVTSILHWVNKRVYCNTKKETVQDNVLTSWCCGGHLGACATTLVFSRTVSVAVLVPWTWFRVGWWYQRHSEVQGYGEYPGYNNGSEYVLITSVRISLARSPLLKSSCLSNSSSFSSNFISTFSAFTF